MGKKQGNNNLQHEVRIVDYILIFFCWNKFTKVGLLQFVVV